MPFTGSTPSTLRVSAQLMLHFFFLRGSGLRGWQGETPPPPQSLGIIHFPNVFELRHLVEIMWPQVTEENLCPGRNGGAPGRTEMKGMEEAPHPSCHWPASPQGILVQRHSYLLSWWPPPLLPPPPPPPPRATPAETHRGDTGCLIGLLQLLPHPGQWG